MDHRSNLRTSALTRRHFLKLSGLSAAALSMGSLASTPLAFAKEPFPSDDIIFLIPSKPGGVHDIYARSLNPYLTKYFKEVSPGAKGGDLRIKNEPASGGLKAYSMLFNAKPNGLTIGVIDTAVITDGILEKPEFDYSKLTMLLVGNYTVKVVVTSAKKGFKNWNEAMDAMKKQPVKMAAGSFGRSNHICSIIMNEKMGTKFKLINFPGTADCLNAVLRGDVQTAFVVEDAVQSLVEAGEMRVLLSFTEASEYPGAVSVKELGYPELATQISSIRFIGAPPGLEEEPKKILLAALKKAQSDKEFVAWAKKSKYYLGNLYGSDADAVYNNFRKFYEGLAPRLKKHLS